MSITHSSVVRGSLAEVVKVAVDQGSTFGKLKILTSGDTLLATITLQDPAFSRSGAILTLLGVPLSATGVAEGTAAKVQVCDSDDNIIYEGSVATSGADFTIDNASITIGQTVRITAHTYTSAV